MLTIGFSTGAIAFGDFRRALTMLEDLPVNAVELSALRLQELEPLVDVLDELDLHRYQHVAFHAPSRFAVTDEDRVIRALRQVADRGWWIIVHPDSIKVPLRWKPLESKLCFENMDKRKPIGRTSDELEAIFRSFPESTLCFDVGHAHQVDRTMSEAIAILQRFGSRVRQMHVSEVNTASEHVAFSVAMRLAVQKILDLVDDQVPLILESVVAPDRLMHELTAVRSAFEGAVQLAGFPD